MARLTFSSVFEGLLPASHFELFRLVLAYFSCFFFTSLSVPLLLYPFLCFSSTSFACLSLPLLLYYFLCFFTPSFASLLLPLLLYYFLFFSPTSYLCFSTTPFASLLLPLLLFVFPLLYASLLSLLFSFFASVLPPVLGFFLFFSFLLRFCYASFFLPLPASAIWFLVLSSRLSSLF